MASSTTLASGVRSAATAEPATAGRVGRIEPPAGKRLPTLQEALAVSGTRPGRTRPLEEFIRSEPFFGLVRNGGPGDWILRSGTPSIGATFMPAADLIHVRQDPQPGYPALEVLVNVTGARIGHVQTRFPQGLSDAGLVPVFQALRRRASQASAAAEVEPSAL